MNDEELWAIEARLKAITPGQWTVQERDIRALIDEVWRLNIALAEAHDGVMRVMLNIKEQATLRPEGQPIVDELQQIVERARKALGEE